MVTDAPTGHFQRWRADAISGVANGAAVSSWPSSDGGVTLAQATPAAQPTYVVSAVNGQPAVRWPNTASNGVYLSGTTASQAQPVTITAVVKPGTTTGAQHVLHWNDEVYYGATTSRWSAYAGASLTSTANFTATWSVVSVVFNGVNTRIYVNGTLAATTTLTPTNGLGTALNLGRHATNTANAWRGDIAEVLAYPSALSAASLADLHTYVQQRYGIVVADYIPEVHSGSADLTGTGTLSATGKQTEHASIALSGTGTLTGVGTPSLAQPVNLSGSGSLSSTATPSAAQLAALSGFGALAASGGARLAGAAALAGAGTLGFAGLPALATAVSLTGSGALQHSGSPAFAEAGALAAEGVLSAIGRANLRPYSRHLGIPQTRTSVHVGGAYIATVEVHQ